MCTKFVTNAQAKLKLPSVPWWTIRRRKDISKRSPTARSAGFLTVTDFREPSFNLYCKWITLTKTSASEFLLDQLSSDHVVRLPPLLVMTSGIFCPGGECVYRWTGSVLTKLCPSLSSNLRYSNSVNISHRVQ